MVFIVSDQRIATENFEKGKIYKIVFLDESIFYGVCLGIGSNFVMLSGNISGYLFPLTMETASQVESIDLFDPTPPEPPVPWTNLLQYQTGAPPFTFNTTDEQLFSWYITGAGVGDKTANLFDISVLQTEGTRNYYLAEDGTETSSSGWFITQYIPVNGDNITISGPAGINPSICAYDENKQYLRGKKYNGINATLSIQNAKFVRFSLVPTSESHQKAMLNYGTTTEPFEPYGYKIPILCNEHLTNIYLDAPLEEDEILYSTDIDTNIITDIGNNILSVETTPQPSEMQIVYKIADR